MEGTVVRIPTDVGVAGEIGRWLDANAGDWSGGDWTVVTTDDGFWNFRFRDARVATMFVLRWT